MANSLDVKIAEQGHRNAILHIVGVVDTNDLAIVPAIRLSDFALNGNDPKGTFNGLALIEADYSGTPGLLVELAWNAATPQKIVELSTTMEYRGRKSGDIVPNRLAAGYDGNINLSTRGFTPGYAYGFTLRLKMMKKYSW